MRNGNFGLFDSARPHFNHRLQRGTTIIRCSHTHYYDEIERRKNLLHPLSAAARPVGVRQPMRKAPSKRTTSPKRTAAVAVPLEDCLQHEDDTAVWRPRIPSFFVGLSRSSIAVEEHCQAETPCDRADANTSQSYEAETPDAGGLTSSLPENTDTPRVKLDWERADECSHNNGDKPELREKDRQWFEGVVRGYIDIAHALLRHFEETLGAKQRLTLGSLQCAEIVCNALQQVQDANPRLALLVQRISTAISLLHKRKLSDERDALGFSQLGGYGSYDGPIYAYQPRRAEQRQPRAASISSTIPTSGPQEAPLEYPNILLTSAQHDLPTAEKYPVRTVSPSVIQPTSSSPLVSAAPPVLPGPPMGPPYLSRPVLGHPDDGISRCGTDTASAVHSSKDDGGCMEGTAPGAFRTNVDVPTAIPPRASTVPYRSEHTRRGHPPSSRTYGVVPIASLHTGISSGPRDTFASSVHEPERPPGTHVVDGGKPKACQLSRPVGAAIHFGGCEGDRTVRPLILSETRTLSDKGASNVDGDPQDIAVEEALSLIKCATDLIVSGEGPEYVEKQFFCYSRSKEIKAAPARPHIPEGMAAAQGKYILLCYAIAALEAEYGDTPKAADLNLYLPDLRRMTEILLGSEPRPRPAPSGRTSAEGLNKGGDMRQQPQNSNVLPERSPEQRMERHLPLTILNLPAIGPRPDGTQRLASPQSSTPVQGELHRSSSRHELERPTSNAKNMLGEADVAGSNIADAVIRQPSVIQCLPRQVSDPLETHIEHQNTMEMRENPPKFAPLVPLDISFSLRGDDDAQGPANLGAKISVSSLPRQPSRPSSPAPASGQPSLLPSISDVLARRSGSELSEASKQLPASQVDKSLAALRKSSIVGEEGRMKFLLSNKPGASLYSRGPVASEMEGLKLSTSSVLRVSASDTITSRIFEAPKTPAEPPVIGLATSFALMNLGASRTIHPPLPDVPKDDVGSAGSGVHD